MDDDTRGRLRDELRRLVLAESDMKQATAAAEYMSATTSAAMNDGVARVLWTGLIVTYARPFGRNKVGPIKRPLARPDDLAMRALHCELCRRRGDLFAHNDKTANRGIVDVYAKFGVGTGHYGEEYSPPNPETLARIAELAREQQRRFRQRHDAIEKHFGRTTDA